MAQRVKSDALQVQGMSADEYLLYKTKSTQGGGASHKIYPVPLIRLLMRITSIHYEVATSDVPAELPYMQQHSSQHLVDFPVANTLTTTTVGDFDDLLTARRRGQSAPYAKHSVLFSKPKPGSKTASWKKDVTFSPQNQGFLVVGAGKYSRLLDDHAKVIHKLAARKRSRIANPLEHISKGYSNFFKVARKAVYKPHKKNTKTRTSSYDYCNADTFNKTAGLIAVAGLAEGHRNLLMLPLARIFAWRLRHAANAEEQANLFASWPANDDGTEAKLRALHVYYEKRAFNRPLTEAEYAARERAADVECKIWNFLRDFICHPRIHKIIKEMYRQSKYRPQLKSAKQRLLWAITQAFYQKVFEPYSCAKDFEQEDFIETCVKMDFPALVFLDENEFETKSAPVARCDDGDVPVADGVSFPRLSYSA